MTDDSIENIVMGELETTLSADWAIVEALLFSRRSNEGRGSERLPGTYDFGNGYVSKEMDTPEALVHTWAPDLYYSLDLEEHPELVAKEAALYDEILQFRNGEVNNFRELLNPQVFPNNARIGKYLPDDSGANTLFAGWEIIPESREKTYLVVMHRAPAYNGTNPKDNCVVSDSEKFQSWLVRGDVQEFLRNPGQNSKIHTDKRLVEVPFKSFGKCYRYAESGGLLKK